MAARTAAARKPAALEPVTPEVLMPEESLTVSEGGKVTSFLKNARQFFATATRLEQDAVARLTKARTFRMPTTLQQDVDLQVFIRECSMGKKGVTEHWEITSLIHGLHKRLVAARKRGEDANEEAANLAQRLHNQYVEQERRRAQEEEHRRRLEEQRKAEEARQAELADLEAKALAAESTSPDLSDRERTFVDLVAQGATHEIAARTSGFKDPKAQAARLIASPKILAALKAREDARAMRQQAQATRQKPVEIQDVRVTPNLQSVGTDRTTWSGEIFDGVALRNAAIEDEMLRRSGQKARYGIPVDVLMCNPTVVNDHARSLHERIDAWPGCRHVKKTRTV